jgi:hypothetical protein
MAAKLAQRYLRQRGRHLLNPSSNRIQKGRQDVSFGVYLQALTDAYDVGPKHYARVNGWSPGFVARLLGISRQGVYNAIERGTLTAYYIHDESGTVQAVVIPEASVREYSARNEKPLTA